MTFFLCDHAALYATTDFFTGDAALYTSHVGEDEGCAAPFEDEVGCAALPGRDEGCPAPSEAEGQRAAGCAAPLDGVGACCCGGAAGVISFSVWATPSLPCRPGASLFGRCEDLRDCGLFDQRHADEPILSDLVKDLNVGFETLGRLVCAAISDQLELC